MVRIRSYRCLLFISIICGLLVFFNLLQALFQSTINHDLEFEHFFEKLNIYLEEINTTVSWKPDITKAKHSLWFFEGRRVSPESAFPDPIHQRSLAKLWPHEDSGDRILNQLMFIPDNFLNITSNGTRVKKIFFYHGISAEWNYIRPGRHLFLESNCPVNTCTISVNDPDIIDADAVFVKDSFIEEEFTERFNKLNYRRPQRQIWIIFLLETPLSTAQYFNKAKIYNWTATYRHDSDIVAPYGKFVTYDPNIKTLPVTRNFAANKTREVAWFVSNCFAKNNRLGYALELSNYINVDIYGRCGNKICQKAEGEKCLDMLNKDYKFYLAFENSNCIDYITEKFFINALGHDVIPIVMGARKEDYLRVAPYHSFISVEDFKSPKELARYLHLLNDNDTLYNEFFAWKGTGEFINTYFLCRVCALLHDQFPEKSYDMSVWWNKYKYCSNSKRKWWFKL